MTPGPSGAVQSRAVAGNAAVTAAMGRSPAGGGSPWTGQMMLAGQDLVGNQAVAAKAGALPTTRQSVPAGQPVPAKQPTPGQQPPAGQPVPGQQPPAGQQPAGKQPAGKPEPGKPEPAKKPVQKAAPRPGQKGAEERAENGAAKKDADGATAAATGDGAGRRVDVGLAAPRRLSLPSFMSRFDAPASLPPLRASTSADRDALSTAAQTYARLADRARRAHDAQLSLLARMGRTAQSRHDRVDGRARSRVARSGAELDDLRLRALGSVDTAYQAGLAGLELAVRRSRRLVASASASALRRVRANANTAGAEITTIVNDLASGYTDTLEQSAVAITTAAGQAIPVVQAYGTGASALFPGGANPVVAAENEARRLAVPAIAKAAAAALTKASTSQSQAYRDQIPVVRKQFSESELATALTKRKNEIGTLGRAAVEKATREAYGALTKQAASGRDALRRMAGDARESIEARHKAARTRLVGEADGLVTGSRARAAAELTGLETAGKTGLPAFSRMITSVRDGLRRAAAISADSLRRSADEAAGDAGPRIDQLGTAQQRMVANADASTDASMSDAEQAAVMAAGRTRADAARTLRAAGKDSAHGIRDFVHGHDASFAATARGVGQVADAWAMPLRKVFGDAVAKTKQAMTGPFTEWKTTTETERDGFISGTFAPYMTPSTALAGPVNEAAEPIAGELERRESEVEGAFAGWGTDEALLSRALRGMTATQGRAVTWLFERKHGSLDAALQGEVSGDELTAARNYLRGDQAGGAAAELKASIGFFNDDEARIEETMRNLKPEELAKLKGSKEGAEALAEARDNLGGTDLKVFDALAAGNQDLADAFRMKDRIDSARQAGDMDALHDVFIDYGKAPAERGRAPATADERRVAVQRELAGIIGGTGRTTAPITPEQAAAAVEKYALDPIDVVVAGPEGTTTTEKRPITGANRALAVALISGGENTVAARAARLGVETQRPGGPNMLKLDAALVDPRLKPGAPEEERKKALAERNEVIQKFATDYGGADKAGTAAAATNYLEGRLRSAYGDNKDGADLAVRLAREQYPTPMTAAMAVKYASAGAGTDEALMFRFVERMDRDEIAKMRVEYKNLTGSGLDEDLGTFGNKGWFTELSGDERLKMEVALLGVPRNDRERAEVASFRIQQQREETGGLGSWLAGDSLADRSLKSASSRLTESLGGATVKVDDKGNPVWTDAGGKPMAPGGALFDKKGTFTGKDPREFASAVRVSKLAAENYAATIDSYANILTTAVMVVGAIVAAVVTVATGGAASPLLIAAIAGLTGLGSMAVHRAVSGGRYGWEQAAVDLGMTAVQALTAGVGQHLSIVSRGGTQSLAAGMTSLRRAQNLSNTMGKITGSELGDLAVIGAATGGLGGFGGALLDEATWSKGLGAGFGALLEATLIGAAGGAVSTVTSQAFESLPFGRAVAGDRRPTISEVLSGSVAARAALRGTSSFLGGATGRGVELGIESARGRFHGDAGDILEEMGKAGLQSAVEESAAGPLGKPGKRTRPGHEQSQAARVRLEELRGEWPELHRSLEGNPVARDSLLAHPDSVAMLDAALGDVRVRLERAGIADAVRSGEITPEVMAKVDRILTDLRAENPNESLGRADQLAIAREIAAGTTKEGYKQKGFDLNRRRETAYQEASVDRLRKEAPKAQRQLNRIVKRIAEDNRGEASWRKKVKDRGRSLRKVQEYVEEFPDGDASMLVDVVGARIRFDSVDALYNALDALKNDPRLDIVRIKDRVADATESGNRSVLMNVRLPNGHVAELKFSLKSFEVPSTTEHPLYEVRRDLKSTAKAEDRKLTPVESLLIAATDAHARRMYGEAWQREMAGSRLRQLLTDHPDVAAIADRLVADSVLHPTNLAKALADPATRDATIAVLGELAGMRTLDGRTLDEYRAESPGRGPLFERVDASVNKDEGGRDRKAVLAEEATRVDPARDIGATPTPEQSAQLADYADRLRDFVQPAVEAEINAFVARVAPESSVSVRTKSAAGILDKVQRMTQGQEGRPGRPGYRAGDVIDAVGARITTADMADLARILEAAKNHFGVGTGGRILEIENMYAEPKEKNPAYRVIPIVVRVDVGGVPYTFELQLTTLRASIAADLEHNTLFKPYVEMSSDEAGKVRGMLAEAAALDQEETR